MTGATPSPDLVEQVLLGERGDEMPALDQPDILVAGGLNHVRVDRCDIAGREAAVLLPRPARQVCSLKTQLGTSGYGQEGSLLEMSSPVDRPIATAPVLSRKRRWCSSRPGMPSNCNSQSISPSGSAMRAVDRGGHVVLGLCHDFHANGESRISHRTGTR
ncbi:MAG: hypothetical protein WKF73_22375 [Nocardioidaceae bacterium]